ncbi:Bug family tripartite tricarboxylate transporter substrate binding protein [Achromobacter pulmonis]|nr:tripartite tricarboxylate transporter substrate binding protein [Achromobacter pulmonis]
MSKIVPLFRAWLTALAALGAGMSASHAGPWPDQPIRVIVPAPPGGISDGVARLVGGQLQARLGQPVIVENKPGGSAVVAERALMAAPADGYTLMIGPSSLLTDFPLTVKTPFDPIKTFTYVTDVASMVHVLVANASLPAKSVQEVLDLARKDPEAVSIANLSVGTRSDMLGEMLREKSGGNILTVPYKGSTPALLDVMGGQVQLTFEVVGNVASQVRSGKLRPLGLAAANRSTLLPDVPSLAELGYPEFALPEASVGVFVLSSMPEAMRNRIRGEVESIKQSAEFGKMLASAGYEAPQPGTYEALQRKMADTIEQNRKLLRRLRQPVSG